MARSLRAWILLLLVLQLGWFAQCRTPSFRRGVGRKRDGSCINRCGEAFNNKFSCQCNSGCSNHGDCCPDHTSRCFLRSGGTPRISDDDLRSVSESLILLDDNNVGSKVEVNKQNRGRKGCSLTDNAPSKLFTRVDGSIWDIPTFRKLQALLDNYNPDVTVSENSNNSAEENAFLDAVMRTRVMRKAYNFLRDKGLFTGNENQFRAKLKKIWFKKYDRDGTSATVIGSSGFEHVFVGEVKGSDISGFHNWVSFYRKENDPQARINYLGYLDEANFGKHGSGLSFKFTWEGKKKCYGSMFVGTTPELDMALYTICFMARSGEVCRMSLAGSPIFLTTYPFRYNGDTLIGTAYPDWNDRSM